MNTVATWVVLLSLALYMRSQRKQIRELKNTVEFVAAWQENEETAQRKYVTGELIAPWAVRKEPPAGDHA